MLKEEDRYLCFGLIPTFVLIKNLEVNLGDFRIENIDWVRFKKYFPDIDLNRFPEYKYTNQPYFIVFGELTDCPAKEFPEGEVSKSEGKTRISVPPFKFLDIGLDSFDRVILLLNLFKYSSVPIFTSVGFFRWTDGTHYLLRDVSANIATEEYIDWEEESFNHYYWLKGDELKQLIAFKENVHPLLLREKPSKNDRYLQIAMEYFLEGCRKEANGNDEMAALDFIIALEAMYLEQDQELKYKFQNRVAMLLGDNDEERDKFQKYSDEVYNLRSKIVHGGLSRQDIQKKLPSTTGRQIGGKVYSIRELTRISLVYFLSLHLNGLVKQQDILQKINSALFNKKERDWIMWQKRRLAFK